MTAEGRDPALQRLHPATFFVVFWGICRRFLLPGLVVVLFGGWPGELMLMWLAVPALLWSGVKYLSTGLAITDEAIVLREGLTGRSYRRIPMSRIRSIETRRSLAHRLFNVDDVVVHTGSNSEAEAILSAVGEDTVRRLRARVEGARPPLVPSENEGEVNDRNQWRCSVGDYIGYGMSYRRGILLWVVLIGFVWQANLFTWNDFERLVRYTAEFLGSSPLSWAVTGTWLLVALWVTSRFLSVIWSLVTFYPFTLRIEGDHVHLSFGLLFHRNQTLPEKHVHMLQLEEKPLHRLSKKVTLHAWTAATLGGGDGEKEGNREWNSYFNQMVLHPFLTRAAAKRLVREVAGEPDWEALDWQGLDPRAFRFIMLRGLALVPVCGALAYFYFPWGMLSVPLAGALLWWTAWVGANHTKYAVTAHGLWLRTGYFNKRWRMIGHGQIQLVETVESPLDRRKGLTKLRVDGFSAPGGLHPVRIPLLSKDQADRVRNRLALLVQKTGV